jgi:catechol 2,3-dioxygenase-like lactoylglutathione lyase family enzyme
MATQLADAPQSKAAARQAANRIRGLSHAAIRVRDIETTRHFYEDILGLPLTYCRVDRLPGRDGAPVDFIHAFFEMGNGSFVAFFEFPEERMGEPFQQSGDDLETHFAMRVETQEDLRAIERRLADAGWKTHTVPHSWCESIYFLDPDNWPLEVTWHYDMAEKRLDQPETAREAIRTWIAAGRRLAGAPLNAPEA